MKIVIPLVLLFSSIIAVAQQTQERFYNQYWKECQPADARFYSVTTQTDSGFVVRDYYLSSKLPQMIGKYKDIDGKIKDGYFYYYYPNGNLKEITRYVNGKAEGISISYHPNANIADSGFYKDDQQTGVMLSWHPNGYMQDSTVVDGVDKVVVSWFDNGNVSRAGRYRNKIKTGKWVYYHKNGKLSSIELFDNGRIKEKACYDEDGQIKEDTATPFTPAMFKTKDLKAWREYLIKKVVPPSGYKIINSPTASVVVSFTINEDGDVENAYVDVPFHEAYDRVALDAIINSPKWIPATEHNRRVKYRVRQPIIFTEQEE